MKFRIFEKIATTLAAIAGTILAWLPSDPLQSPELDRALDLHDLGPW